MLRRITIAVALSFAAMFFIIPVSRAQDTPGQDPGPHLVLARTVVARAAAILPAHYAVRSGDTLSRIAADYYGSSSLWPALWWVNKAKVSDPNLIYVGQVLYLSPWHPAEAWLTIDALAHVPHAQAAPTPTWHSAPVSPTAPVTPVTVAHPTSSGGNLSFAGLENLWVSDGGAVWAEATAACIAEHESSGNQFATGPVGERGYWQISPDHGSLSTYDPYGNARAAIIISNDGTNWSAWTTAPMCGV